MKNSIFRLNMMNEYEKVIGFIVTWSEGLTAEVWSFAQCPRSGRDKQVNKSGGSKNATILINLRTEKKAVGEKNLSAIS